MENFSDLTIKKIGYYVYALIDPRDNSVFYIGKGIGNRVFEHEKEDGNALKNQKIAEIKNAGFEVKKVIILHGINENDNAEKRAYTAESALINLMRYINPNGLTNSVSGHHSFEGAMTVEQIENIYGAEILKPEEINPDDKVLTVKINILFDYSMDEESLKDAIRGHWKVKKNCDAKYIAGVYRGVIVGIFKIDKWYSSDEDSEYYCRNNELGNNPGRYYCTCSSLNKDDVVYKRYMNKNISSILKQQNPVKYLY